MIMSSDAVLAEISLRSPRKIFIKKINYRIKVSNIKKINFEKNFTDNETFAQSPKGTYAKVHTQEV